MSLLKDSSIVFLSRIVTIFCGLAIASATAWLLKPVGCGELAVYTVVGLLLALASSGGIEMAGGYYAGIRKYKISEIISGLFFITLMSTVISAIAVYLIWRYQVISIDTLGPTGLTACVCFVPALLLSTSLWYLHSALGHAVVFSVSHIISQGSTAITIFLISWQTRSPELAMYAYVIGQSAAAVYLLFELARKEKLLPISFSFLCIKDLYTYGIKYYFGRMSEFVNIQLGTIVITFIGGAADIGYFSKAVALTGRIAIIPEVLNSVLLSRIVKGQEESLEIVAKLIRMVFWAIVVVCSVIAVFSKPIVGILFSSSFYPIIIPILLLLPGILVRSCSKVLALYYNGIGRPELNSYSLASAIVVNIVLMIFLLPHYGVSGAAMATSCGYLVDGVVLLFFFTRVTGRSIKVLVPTMDDIVAFRVFFDKAIKKKNTNRKYTFEKV